MAESLLASPTVVNLTESDIPGALLSEPLASHTMPELRWWLLCRGIKVPTSWNKHKLLSRLVAMCSIVFIFHCIYYISYYNYIYIQLYIIIYILYQD